MNLPKVIADLVKAQDQHDSIAYANCFSETGVMHDEGKTQTGRIEIQKWIAGSNLKYKTVMKPLNYRESDNKGILAAEISGTFDGSPIVLNFHFEFKQGLIQSLKITG
ncbi:MAG TPA: nuclear transport factor 2 family protein [Bacteroidia bacterium]